MYSTGYSPSLPSSQSNQSVLDALKIGRAYQNLPAVNKCYAIPPQALHRMKVDDISVIGRNTSGVKLMSINQDSDIKVASIAKVRESVTKDSNVYDEEYYEEENGDSEEESEADVDSDETV